MTDDIFKKLSGWVEAKLRILTMQLEQVSGMLVHPNPHQYDIRGTDPEFPHGCGMFIALSFTKDGGAFGGMNVDLRPAWAEWLAVINQWVEKDAHHEQYRLRLRRIKASELPKYALGPELEGSKKRGKEQNGGANKKARAND